MPKPARCWEGGRNGHRIPTQGFVNDPVVSISGQMALARLDDLVCEDQLSPEDVRPWNLRRMGSLMTTNGRWSSVIYDHNQQVAVTASGQPALDEHRRSGRTGRRPADRSDHSAGGWRRLPRVAKTGSTTSRRGAQPGMTVLILAGERRSRHGLPGVGQHWLYLEEPEEVALYERTLRHVHALAANPEESRGIIKSAMKEV
ncbi:hypothetical protein GCM10009676_18590 [Prauserella halophila]|uniref:DUF5753 domain-containing protein n=1 Tax=Prauserella halophila TaxID=185641 RepID=A0ABN1W6Q2_9PSEU|nr:hypothetical protein [Prauserella halophila]MCP2235939.1 hypothetical protein [Prauserella halophila]